MAKSGKLELEDNIYNIYGQYSTTATYLASFWPTLYIYVVSGDIGADFKTYTILQTDHIILTDSNRCR